MADTRVDESKANNSQSIAADCGPRTTGPRTRLHGHVHGSVFSGEFHGPVQVGDVIQQPPPPRLPMQKPPRTQYFIGREEELVHLLADLQPGRVVTLCGPGGIGKTALAAEAVWRLAPGDEPPEHFRDGILFHSFYRQPQADLVLEAIARAYGEDPRGGSADAARRALAGRQALLVLDGAEVANDLDVVLDVAGSCAVLVTSRQHHDAPAQWQDLSPLPQAEAVRLLQAWGQDCAADTDAANRICELVGRLPLALFLAGHYLAWCRQQAVEYLAWLEESPLEALNLGERQHQSIPLLLARSLEHVSARALAALGVAGLLALAPFPTKVVAAALNVPTGAAGRALGELVDYGLLIRPGENYQVSHTLIHVYARERLVPPGEALQRLAAHYEALADEQSTLGLPGYALLDDHRAHILSVQGACQAMGAWGAVCALAKAIDSYLDLRGYWTERVTVAKAGLAGAQAAGERSEEGCFLSRLGNAYADLGEMQQAVAHHEEALTIAREIGDRQSEGADLGNLGNAYAVLEKMQKALACYRQALAISQELGDRQGEGADLGNLGNLYAALGDARQAISYYEQALTIAREIGDHRGECNHHGNMGSACAALGDIPQAISHYEQALSIAHETGGRPGEGAILGNLGLVYYSLGKVRQAITNHEQARAIHSEIGDQRGEAADWGNIGSAYVVLGEVRKAITCHEQALAIHRKIGDRRGEAADLGNLGNAHAASGAVREAIAYHMQALVIAREIGDRRGEGTHLGNLASAFYSLGEVHNAIESYEQALAIHRELGDRIGESNWLCGLGNVSADLGEIPRAIGYYEQALTITHATGDRQNEEALLGNLGNACYRLGEKQKAIAYFEQALTIARATGDRQGESNQLGNLGNVCFSLDNVPKAIEYYEQALVVVREIGDRRSEALINWNLSLAYGKAGNLDQAIVAMQACVAYEREIGHPEAEQHATQLAKLRARQGA